MRHDSTTITSTAPPRPMNDLFADTSFFIALLSRHDVDHARAVQAAQQRRGRLITTAWVLTELGNFLKSGTARSQFLRCVAELDLDSTAVLVPPTPEQWRGGVELFANRTDKNWSLTDCISFVVMQQMGVTSALTADHHFQQAGFRALLLEDPPS